MARTAHWGVGAMGSLCLEAARRTPGIEVVAVAGQRRDRDVRGVAESILGAGSLTGEGAVEVRGDGRIEEAVRAAGGADVLFLATDAALPGLADDVVRGLRAGMHVICIAEESLWPAAFDPSAAERMRQEAQRAERAVVGTGINPGFAMDVLPAVLSAAITEWTELSVRRVNDLSQFGHSVLEDMGVGLEPEEFERRWRDGELAAHRGFPGSIAVIADALGTELEIVEQSCAPIVRDFDTVLERVSVPAGRVVGTNQRCVARTDAGQRVVLEHPQRVGSFEGEEEPRDTLRIEGPQALMLEIPGSIAGAAGTVALMINSALALERVSPGLHTAASLPLAHLAQNPTPLTVAEASG